MPDLKRGQLGARGSAEEWSGAASFWDRGQLGYSPQESEMEKIVERKRKVKNVIVPLLQG